MGLLPYIRPKYLDDNSVLANGYQLFFYIAGTATKQNTFTDSGLGTPNPNPIILNARGEPDNAGSPIDIYLTPGLSYKVVLATDTDTDPPTSPVWSVDNVTDSGGGGGGAGAAGQWLTGDTAVYVNATNFKLVGVDVTVDYHKGRRVWLSGGANRYAQIFSSAFAAGDTTVTCVNIEDGAGAAAALDPIMTTSSLSIQRVDADNAIHFRFYPGTDTGVTNFEFPIGDIRRYGALMDGVNDNAAFVSCVAATPAGGTITIPDGTAAINAITFVKEVHIEGTGMLQQISANANFLTFGVGSDGSSIENITIDANQTPGVQLGYAIVTSVANITIKNNVIEGGEWGVHVTTATSIGTTIIGNRLHTNRTRNISCDISASQIKIINNKLEASDEGIRITACTDVIISDNTILDFVDGGIRILEETVAHTSSEEVMISNNYLSNDGIVAAASRGIDVLSSNFVNIINNIIDKLEFIAFYTDHSGAGSAVPIGLTIIGNTIIEPVETALYIGRLDKGIISNNNLITNGVSNYGIRAVGGGVGGVTNTIISKNNIGAVVITEFIHVGLNITSLAAENLLTTGPQRSDDLTFEGASFNINNCGYSNIQNLSATTTDAKNFHGLVVWPGGSATSNAVVFGTAEVDVNYEIIVADRGTQSPIWVTAKTVNGFSLVTTDATMPPAAHSRAWFLIRVPTAANN